MRINRTVRKAIGFICLFMALGGVRIFITHIRDNPIYDPQVAADVVWMVIYGFGIWWGFRKEPDSVAANRDMQGEWPTEKHHQ
jgi:hypothetical protein